MPGTTRYSATFDRTYEEDDRLGPPPPANTRRSRSQSWQAHSGLDGRPYTPLGSRPPAQRSSSTDSGASKVPDIPTRTVGKTAVKAHNNPFQFVKVGTCPLYKRAEEQLKKTKEEKKQDVFKEEEEEWQSNLDSWKSRRRKMSEDVFRRQEEIKQFELEEQEAQVSQKKIKTFSEMVESRAHRGRTLSLCLISNPLEFQDWEFENKGNTNGSCSTFTDESEENSTVNSEDEGVSLRGRQGRPTHHDNQKGFRTNGEAHIEQNGSKLETHNSDFNNVQKPKEGSYIDSGLESISSSHRAGDTPDSGSDFSQDSNSSIDCESPRTGVNILEEFNSKSLQMSSGRELSVKLSLTDKAQGFGFEFQGGKDAGQVLIKSTLKGSRAELSGVHVGDQIIAVEGTDVSSKTHSEITTMVQKGVEKGAISLHLWRHNKTTNGFNVEEKHVGNPVKPNKDSQNVKLESQQYEKSIESENEMYVDDFEELQRQSELLTSNMKSEASCTNSQAQSNGNTSPIILSSDKDSIKSSPALKLTENISNGAVDKQNKNEKTDSEISPESPKKNIVKVKRVRRKGVYALDVSGIPNEIPQEGIPLGSLYPLSPVTELPSPADETKTMSSTLSSNPTTPVSNSLNNILLEKAVKETEAKLNSYTIKENNKTTASPKSVTSRTTVSSNELKISTPDKVESKTDSTSVPTSPTVAKKKENISLESSLEDKPKIPSSPKKVKVKVKKANSESEQKSSESSPIGKEALSSSVTQISDLSAKKLAPESQPKKEQRSDSVADGKTIKINKNENLESSPKRENNISSSETAAVQTDAISSSLKDKTSSIKGETSCATTRNLSLKIGVSKEYDNLATTPPATSAKPPKTPVDEKSKPPYAPKKEKAKPKDNNAPSAEIAAGFPVMKSTASKDKISVANIVTDSDRTRNLTLNNETQNQNMNISVIPPVVNAKMPKTPTDEKSKPSLAQMKENTKPKEKAKLSLATSADCANIEKIESPSTTVSSCNVVTILTQTTIEKNECLIPSEVSSAKSDLTQSANTQDEESKPLSPKKTKTRIKKKNTNSQKVNSPAKQNEEVMNLNIDSLNVIFQSEPKNKLSENQSVIDKNSENNSNKKAATDLVPDIPPVEKVAEEMEKLILEQLEEEERAKELASQTKNAVGSPEHLLIAPPRLVEPPKEKPPPPPSASEGSQKDSSLKRVNSTKRIKKEIHKRRSNFLGIDNVDESIVCSEPSIPPPPALEEILKAEMELDRQSRLKIESAATERLTLEEKEIMQKEREIIESLECEERQKQLLNGTEDFNNALPTSPSDVYEDDRILSLKNERKRIETERLMTEEQQQLNLLEEKQLREREEFIRKQEAGKSAGSHSDPSLSVAANASNNSKPAISSLTETKPKVSLSDTYGDGGNVTSNSSAGVSDIKNSECDGKDKAPEKPAVPPKPLKKKEAIRKERERLRQEQEALQREREEHRRKLMLEQEESMKHQKSHAPDAPVTQLGPLPPLVPPNFPSQLTTTMNATPNARESASFPSRSHHGASNGTAGNINAVELMGPPIVRQNKLPASRKAVQNEAWGQQKMPSVRKQNHDSLTESRYNQNHWLIQEAEMRRITELKERQQRTTQLPCSQTHLAEDDVCSNPPRVPVIQPTQNPHLNYAVQDKMWNYGQSSMPLKKYPPPVVKDPIHTVYPREAASQQPPTKPSRVVPMERQEQMLSVSGRKRCSHCNEELGRGAAMIIESLQLYYHIHCFQCCVCQAQLGNGSCGTDVRVRNNKLHCHNCYSNDEAGLKFSQV